MIFVLNSSPNAYDATISKDQNKTQRDLSYQKRVFSQKEDQKSNGDQYEEDQAQNFKNVKSYCFHFTQISEQKVKNLNDEEERFKDEKRNHVLFVENSFLVKSFSSKLSGDG